MGMMRGALARWRIGLACFAAVLGFAAPGSGVAGHAHAGNWQEICTAAGERLVRAVEDGLPVGSSHADDDCACCVSGTPVLLHTDLRVPTPASVGRHLLPRGAHAPAAPATAWSRGWPRAPPARAT